jgi:hypothetical protein
MIPIQNDKVWFFVIDTQNYAGNFERQMCAYMTGIVGDCDVGDDEAKIFNHDLAISSTAYTNEKHPFQFIFKQPDEYGCRRPVTIFPTPDLFNDGLGGIYKAGEERDALRQYREKCLREAERLYHGTKEFWEEKAKTLMVPRHPAYNSVAIFMSREPTEGEVSILVDRAKKFIKYWKEEQILITGCRCVVLERKLATLWTKKIVTKQVRTL